MTDVDAMHRFRIAGKKLRYAIELLAPAFAETLRTQAYPFVQELQDRLGKINDLASAQARLKRWLEHADGPEDAAYLQEMLSQEQRRLDQRRSEFLAWWNGGRQAGLRQLLSSLAPGHAARRKLHPLSASGQDAEEELLDAVRFYQLVVKHHSRHPAY